MKIKNRNVPKVKLGESEIEWNWSFKIGNQKLVDVLKRMMRVELMQLFKCNKNRSSLVKITIWRLLSIYQFIN